ncbi:NAD/NADP octopine/nopaline dehydrogenase family protein [Chelativorans sp. AA-79]|uniref:NAD/NADP octopine/nopaline dehydrogenase family protein n=1 Tax=Chelativorans sp. AA-79 TaxID=3028735 RepID=UPI0023F9BBFE|nr:NAD/NADP octopine/nopaline dehydrogenase family protein [Chelativorans sp. AA-79]WEX08000.1 NAD/NADP octopine/nopaline dehydrogenase family protein [Chelativorans sp. AA-79]
MRVAILGAGGVALAMAAMLEQAGHTVAVWSPSGASIGELATSDLVTTGVIEHRLRVAFVPTAAEAVKEANVIIVALPANGHRNVFDAALPHVAPGQTVIVSAQLSMGALYLAQRLEQRGVDVTVIAFATTVLMGRRSGPDTVAIGGIRNLLEIAVLPEHRASEGLQTCRALFGDRFRLAANLTAIALSNLNPPIHMASALCNFTRIEKAEYWANYDAITPSVARFIEALDAERLAVAAAHGVSVRSVEDHYRLTFGFAEGMSVAEMAAAVHEKRKGPPGPTSLETRFVTEDVPFGIVQVIDLAREKSVPVPLHKAGVAIFCALYGRDFRAENDLLPAIHR